MPGSIGSVDVSDCIRLQFEKLSIDPAERARIASLVSTGLGATSILGMYGFLFSKVFLFLFCAQHFLQKMYFALNSSSECYMSVAETKYQQHNEPYAHSFEISIVSFAPELNLVALISLHHV